MDLYNEDMVQALYKDKMRDHAIHAAINTEYNQYNSIHFTTLKISYKWILKRLIIEMQKEINKIDNNLKL